MRILVYGAGVLGCELAHVLMQKKKNGNRRKKSRSSPLQG